MFTSSVYNSYVITLGDKEESGFEDNGSDTKDEDEEDSPVDDNDDIGDEKDDAEEKGDDKISIAPSSAKSSKSHVATDDEYEEGIKKLFF